MPGREIDIVRSGYDAFNRGDLDAVVELMGPDFEWLPPQGSLTAGTYHGPDAVRKEIASWTEPFEDFRWEIEEIVDAAGLARKAVWTADEEASESAGFA